MKNDFKDEIDIDSKQLEGLARFVPVDNIGQVKGTVYDREINGTGSTGMKYDGGKLLANILFEDFGNALTGVMEISTFGAKKYARNSWKTVPDALQRYKDAMVRHQLAMGRGEVYDDESHMLHAAHFAWNALATLELLIKSGTPVNLNRIATPITGTDDIGQYIPEIH